MSAPVCVECGEVYERHSDQADDVRVDPQACGERCPTSLTVTDGPYFTDPDIWGLAHHARCRCEGCLAKHPVTA